MVDDDNCTLKSYQYNDKPTANVVFDRTKESPTAMLMQVTDWKLSTDLISRKEKVEINLSFLEKEIKIDSKGDEQDLIIDRMKDLALTFISRLLSDKDLYVVDNEIDVKSVFHRSDSNRTGVNLSITIEEKQAKCL